MSRTEKVCAAVIALYFGPLLLLVLFLVINGFMTRHQAEAQFFMSLLGGSTGSW